MIQLGICSQVCSPTACLNAKRLCVVLEMRFFAPMNLKPEPFCAILNGRYAGFAEPEFCD